MRVLGLGWPILSLIVVLFRPGCFEDPEGSSAKIPSNRTASTGNPPTTDLGKNATENVTEEFRPSRPLGPIVEEPRIAGPFNNLQHISFENTLRVNQDRNSVEDHSRPHGRVKFQDDPPIGVYALESPSNLQVEISNHEGSTYVPQSLEDDSKIRVPEDQIALVDPNHLLYGHPIQDTSSVLQQQHHLDNSGTPNLPVSYYTGNDNLYPYKYSPIYEESYYNKNNRIPDKSVLYLHQQSYTRTRKFPYQFYQPSLEQADFYGDPRYQQHHHGGGVSPWKKIIHLIGTFLPLGLLLATLTPTVVQIENTTQPNIVLSKLRLEDLPAEHKRIGRLIDKSSDKCEDRNICEMILAGGKPQSNLLQNILWMIASRTTKEAAMKYGLLEIFEAVKKKDCNVIDC